jgi:uncharacterized protein YgiM (DUF1202 family)
VPAPITAAPAPANPETLLVREAELEQRVTRLELQLMERDAQLEDVQGQLDEARREVVRQMARLASTASRAEAASGMAEAEVAVQALKVSAAQLNAGELTSANHLLQNSTVEFNRQNYGGALYLANEAKRVAGTGKGRLSTADRGSLRPGEVLFRLPVPMEAVSRCNVREGPGTGFKVLFSLEPGAALTGNSYLDSWIRVSDASGRSGWVLRSLIGRRKDRPR